MKKIIAIIGFVFLASSYKTLAEVDLGFMSGIYSSSLQIEPSKNFQVESTTTFAAGLFMNIQANELLSLQITPMYLQKGGNAKFDVDFLNYTEFRADYLEVPILLRLNFGAGSIKSYIATGPSIGFQLNHTYLDPNQKEVDLTDQTKNMDISIMVAGGLEIELEGSSLFGQLTYNHGLSNIDNSDGFLDFTDEIYTRGFGFFIGFSVPFGGKQNK